jgi:hypothetical protein
MQRSAWRLFAIAQSCIEYSDVFHNWFSLSLAWVYAYSG